CGRVASMRSDAATKGSSPPGWTARPGDRDGGGHQPDKMVAFRSFSYFTQDLPPESSSMTQVTHAGNPIQIEGQFPQPGQQAPAFKLIAADLSEVSLQDFAGKRKILNIFPSIDTGICATSVRKFNSEAAGLTNTV